MEALEQREQLRRKHALLTQALDETKAAPRMGRNEIRLVRTIDTNATSNEYDRQTAARIRWKDPTNQLASRSLTNMGGCQGEHKAGTG